MNPRQPQRQSGPALSRRSRRGWVGVCVAVACMAVALVNSLRTMAAPRHRLAVFRPSVQEWWVAADDGSATPVRTTTGPFQLDGNGGRDVPVPRDYEGRGTVQLAVFRPSTAEWFIRRETECALRVQFGNAGDQPVPGDYLGLGRAQHAVFRPTTREWLIRNENGSANTVQFGGPEDQPVPADYSGLGRLQIAAYRPATGEWFLRTDTGDTLTIPWGTVGDRPMPGDYLGLGRAQIAVFRPSTREWFIRNDNNTATKVDWGGPDDVPVIADYDGIGRVRISVFRPTTGEWLIRNDDGSTTRGMLGQAGDIPVPAAHVIPVPVLTLQWDIQPILTANCALSGCHGASGTQLGLDLSTAEQAFRNLRGVGSVEVPGRRRVSPCEPENSYLIDKIDSEDARLPNGTDRMPRGAPRLSQEVRDRIRLWIQQGANR